MRGRGIFSEFEAGCVFPAVPFCLHPYSSPSFPKSTLPSVSVSAVTLSIVSVTADTANVSASSTPDADEEGDIVLNIPVVKYIGFEGDKDVFFFFFLGDGGFCGIANVFVYSPCRLQYVWLKHITLAR